jgi:hypothetical protein
VILNSKNLLWNIGNAIKNIGGAFLNIKNGIMNIGNATGNIQNAIFNSGNAVQNIGNAILNIPNGIFNIGNGVSNDVFFVAFLAIQGIIPAYIKKARMYKMPDINVKSFNQMVVMLDKMADGVSVHKGEESFPAILKEDMIRKARENFQNLRETYEQTLTKARLLQNDYRAAEKQLEKDHGRYRSLVYGFYGKKNLTVRDFGMQPFKDGQGKTKKTATKA